ncbi:MAG: adenylosuccinate synthase, partial [Deltaproteobacteria bacterium]|nr:adenylosuccinate synthase [Deltaproteobacteria bacterium]
KLGDYQDLPEAARDYVKRIEDFLGIPVAIVSVGPQRKATFTRLPIWEQV